MKDADLQKCKLMVARALAWATHRLPYVSDTFYALVPKYVPGVQTLGVTKGLVMYVDPNWLMNDKDLNGPHGHEYLGAALYHECGHVLRDMKRIEALVARGRAKGLSEAQARGLANIAADIPINDDIVSAGMKFFDWAETSTKRGLKRGLTMEQVFTELLKDLELTKGQPQDGGSQKGGVCSGSCGGVAGNPGKHAGLEEQLDKEVARDEEEIEGIKEKTREKIREHHASKGIGSTPGFGEQELQKEEVKSQVNWVRELGYIVRKATGRAVAGGSEYTRMRYAQRSILLGIPRPALIDVKPTIGFIRDTSGSMSNKELSHANTEVIAVMKKTGVDQVWFLDADVKAAHTPELVTLREIDKLPVRGRGGTDFCQPIEVMTSVRPKPDVLIYLTDGAGGAPAKAPPGVAFIWCIVPSRWAMRPAPWGKLVCCTNDTEFRGKMYG